MDVLYRVISNRFVCGFVCRNGRVIQAAPIIRWMINSKSQLDAVLILKQKGYTVVQLHER